MTIKEYFQDKTFRLSFFLALIYFGIGLVMLYGGFVLLGWAIFVLLPMGLGVGVGFLPNRVGAWYGLAAGVLLVLVALLVLEYEALICVLFAMPIVIPMLFLGLFIAKGIQQTIKEKKTDRMPVLFLPLLVFLFGGPLEKYLFEPNTDPVVVKSEVIYPYSALQVYDAIKSVDTLNVDKSFLMNLGLPVPQKCILQQEAVGGTRTCYFEEGKIVETIRELEPGKLLRMDVVDFQMEPNQWMVFDQAIYAFEPLGPNACKMTRTSRYISQLKPRFYWTFLEKIGVEQEHDYVFRNLQKDLERKYGQPLPR